MKKTLIAIAALAATSAFAQVSITGTFDPSVAMTKSTYGDDKAVSQIFLRNNSRGTSQVTFRVNEDLGGGLTASALIENDFLAGQAIGAAPNTSPGSTTSTDGPNLFSAKGGELFLGLAHATFGSVKLGAANTPSLTAQGARSPMGTKIGGGANSTSGTLHVRESNSIVYASPVFMGLTIAVGHAMPTAAVTGGLDNLGSQNDIGLFYGAGPIRANASFYSGKGAGQQNFSAQYDLGAATLYAGAHKETLAGVDVSTGMNGAAKYTMGAISVIANYGKLTDKVVANAAAPKNKSILGLGADYALSKNTTAYARFADETNSNVTAADKAKKVTSTIAGLQLNF